MDGWIILGFVSAWLLLVIKKPAYRLITTVVIIHLAFFALFAGFNFPWYQFIIFPVLAVAAGLVVAEFIQKPQWEFNALLFFTVLSPCFII